MKATVKLHWVGHKNDNGPGGYNYKTLHLSQVEFNGVKFSVGGREINMYGHPLSVEGSSVGVHGGAGLKVTIKPSEPPSCENPVPKGEIMNLNRRGEYSSSATGPWDGEGVVEIDDNVLLLIPVAIRIEKRIRDEHVKEKHGILGTFGVCFGCPSVGIRYPRRGRYPYLTCCELRNTILS